MSLYGFCHPFSVVSHLREVTMQRRLAAILAADAVGYSRLRRHQRAGCALD